MSGCHHYVFKVYALDTLLKLEPRSKKQDFLRAISGHIIGYGELIGMYTRKSIELKEIESQSLKKTATVQ
jgi:phosphatidylethanolamine-binding protein (PEBP) family uncharacterized protein